MDVKGQISAEFVLVIGLVLIIVLGIVSFLGEDNELNQVMSAARSGAIEGANMDSFGIYPNDKFNEYNSANSTHKRVLGQTSVKIIRINYKKNDTAIQLNITASAPSVTNPTDRNALGDRINFYARQSICESFNTVNQTNSLFNPAYSNNYRITTTDVYWI